MEAFGIYDRKANLVQVVLDTNTPDGCTFKTYAERIARGWGARLGEESKFIRPIIVFEQPEQLQKRDNNRDESKK